MTTEPLSASLTGPAPVDVWPLVEAPSELAPSSPTIEPTTLPLATGFRVAEVAGTSVALAALAMADAGIARGMLAADFEPIAIATDHALADWQAFVEVGGEVPPAWAELSGRYEAIDGRFVQLHCNFAHHAAGVVERLGVEPARPQVAEAIATWDAFELEDVLRRDGMICAAYRGLEEWAAHPHAAATADLPLVEVEHLGEAAPRPPTTAPERPLDGVRVLDCSRVLAGPVCGRTLAAQGADVLRVGASHLPSVEACVLATGFGKRNAFVDLDTEEGRRRFAGLLAEADVFVDAYRPGALAARGFSAERVAELSPGIVVVEVCAFDWVGPWADRRGFDSIVQSTTGIALSQADAIGSSIPVHLPVQALDFATGYLAAFVAARLLALQQRAGASWRGRVSLLRTRNWLVGLGGPEPFDLGGPPPVGDYLHTVASSFGPLRAVAPVIGHWDVPPGRLGSSRPEWR